MCTGVLGPPPPPPCACTAATLSQVRWSSSGSRDPSLGPVLSLPAPPALVLLPTSVCLATSEPETSRPASRAGHPLGLETASGIGFLRGLRGAVGTQGQPGRPGSPGSARERRREARACVTRRLPAARTSCWGHRCCRAEPAVHITTPGPQARYACGWGSQFTVSRCYWNTGNLGSKTCPDRCIMPIGSWRCWVNKQRAAETF